MMQLLVQAQAVWKRMLVDTGSYSYIQGDVFFFSIVIFCTQDSSPTKFPLRWYCGNYSGKKNTKYPTFCTESTERGMSLVALSRSKSQEHSHTFNSRNGPHSFRNRSWPVNVYYALFIFSICVLPSSLQHLTTSGLFSLSSNVQFCWCLFQMTHPTTFDSNSSNKILNYQSYVSTLLLKATTGE